MALDKEIANLLASSTAREMIKESVLLPEGGFFNVHIGNEHSYSALEENAIIPILVATDAAYDWVTEEESINRMLGPYKRQAFVDLIKVMGTEKKGIQSLAVFDVSGDLIDERLLSAFDLPRPGSIEHMDPLLWMTMIDRRTVYRLNAMHMAYRHSHIPNPIYFKCKKMIAEFPDKIAVSAIRQVSQIGYNSFDNLFMSIPLSALGNKVAKDIIDRTYKIDKLVLDIKEGQINYV